MIGGGIGVRHLLVAGVLASTLAASQLATAQTLYRWTDVQGRTHYGNLPPKDALGLVRIDTGPETSSPPAQPVPPLPPPPPAPRALPPASEAPEKAPTADLATQRRTTRERLRADLNRALDNLEAAKKKLAAGDDMEDGEWQTVQPRGGGRSQATPTARLNCRTETGANGKPVQMCPVTVPNDQYYDRIAKLEAAVREAEEAVAAAESAYRRGVD